MSRVISHILPAHASIAAESLRSWRQTALDQLIVLGLCLAAPVIVLDIVTSFIEGRIGWAIFNMVSLALVPILLLTNTRYWMRTGLMLAAFLIYGTVTLLNAGLAGTGRIHMVFVVILATALLPPTPAIILTGVACLIVVGTLGGESLGLIPLSPQMEAHAHYPVTMVINIVVLALLLLVITRLVLSLIARLTTSLNQAEVALAERDALNSRLEEMVATRTETLERQLVLQRALAGCSRVLMRGGTGDTYQHVLDEALRLILDAVGGDYISVAHYMSYAYGVESLFRSFRCVAEVRAPGVISKTPFTIEILSAMP
ncbi:MAG: hypothetical protein HGA65_05970, partial [Oscillochloris sp.]|nr:hypothetical protein [Oscillochloris sp.]